MASITDLVVEGLKYPFNDIKKLLGCGVLFALISVISVFMGVKSLGIFRAAAHAIEKTNGTAPHLLFSQLPTADIYYLVVLAIITFVVSLFIMGYQYNILKFSIEKRADLPGFSDVVGIFVKGIKYFVVTIAYNIIPMLVLACGIMVGNSPILPIIILISMVLFIIAFFLLIMALNNMAAHDSLKKAFDFREIMDIIANLGRGKYIGIILFTIIVNMIIMVSVGFILSGITAIFTATVSNQALAVSVFIALIQGLFVDSYSALFLNRVYGSVYREAIN